MNERAAAELTKLLDKSPILFVGAGLTIPPYWIWSRLIHEIAVLMGLPSPTETDPLLASQSLYNTNPTAFDQAVIQLFQPRPSECRDALLHIVNIGFKSILTTNFDRTIEEAFAYTNQEPPQILAYPRLLPTLCEAGTVHYIHGRVPDEKESGTGIILHRESYQKSYHDEPRNIPTYLFQVLLSNNVIFTGYSLSPHEPLNHIFTAIKKFSNEPSNQKLASRFPPKTRTILLPFEANNQESKQRLEGLGIDIIEYDKLDENYTGLDLVWRDVFMKSKRSSKTKSALAYDPFSNMPNLP